VLTQLLAAAGATVISTGRTEEGRALLVELGAAHAVDHADLDAAVRELAPDGVDAAVHLAGDPEQIASLVKDGGMMASALLYAPELFPDIGRVTPLPIAGYPTGEALRKLASLIEEGRLRVVIDREHPFSEVERALGESGTRPSET